MVLIAYAWAMMPIIFLLSFAFKEATSAYVWITIANILSGTFNYLYKTSAFLQNVLWAKNPHSEIFQICQNNVGPKGQMLVTTFPHNSAGNLASHCRA